MDDSRSNSSNNNADADPFFHRSHGYLYVKFKQTMAVSFAEPVVEWMRNLFGSSVASSEQQRVLSMATKRNQLRVMSECTPETFSMEAFEKTYLPASSAYINDLHSLILKTQGLFYQGGIPNLRFIWNHWLGQAHGGGVDTNSLHVELFSVIFNLGAAYSLMGCLTPPAFHSKSVLIGSSTVKESQEVLIHRVKMFRYAAFIFQNLKERLMSASSAQTLRDLDDLTPDVMEMFIQVMLAQAQQATYQTYKQVYGTPVAEMTCAQLALAAASYYKEFLDRYESLKRSAVANQFQADETMLDQEFVSDHELHSDPTQHIPSVWFTHCSSARAMMRAQVLMHVQRSLESDTDQVGLRIGYVGKAHAILDQQVGSLYIIAEHHASNQQVPDPDLDRLIKALEAMRAGAAKVHETLKYENEKIYHTTIPNDKVIDSLAIKPQSKVALGATLDLTQAPLLGPVFQSPKDAFPSILSLASASAWLSYRQKRIETYLKHLTVMAQSNVRLASLFEDHPEYLFLYFLYRRMEAACDSGQTAPGFFQSKLGAEMLQLKNPSVQSQLLNTVIKSLPEAKRKENIIMNKLREDVEQMKALQGYEMIQKRFQVLLAEFDLTTKTQAGELLEQLRQSQADRDFLALLQQPPSQVVEKLFGPLAKPLFEVPKPLVVITTISPTPVTAKITETGSGNSGGGGFALLGAMMPWKGGSNQTPAAVVVPNVPAPPTQVPDPALVATTTTPSAKDKLSSLVLENTALALGAIITSLMDQHFLEREKLEDQIASEFLNDIDRKDTELNPKDINDLDFWIEENIKWIMEKAERIFQLSESEKILIKKLEELDPGIEVLMTQIDTALRPIQEELRKHSKNDMPMEGTASTGGEVVQPPSLAIYNPRTLQSCVRSGIRIRQCKRYASLCKRLAELVEQDAQAVSLQCSDILAANKAAKQEQLLLLERQLQATNLLRSVSPSTIGGNGKQQSLVKQPQYRILSSNRV